MRRRPDRGTPMRLFCRIALVAVFLAATSCGRVKKDVPPEPKASPTPARKCVFAEAKSACESALEKTYDDCAGAVAELDCPSAARECSSDSNAGPWACLRECAKTADCALLPACAVQCEEKTAPPAAGKAREGMAAIPAGWSVMRFAGQRWRAEGLSWKLVNRSAFSMDLYEFPNKPGEKPASGSWNDADAACRAAGKRLCSWAEWQKVCGQSVGTAYPFGDERREGLCAMPPCDSREESVALAPIGGHPECQGRYGVYDLAGNVSEFLADLWQDGGADRMVAGGSHNLNCVTMQKADEKGRWSFTAYGDSCSSVHHHAPDVPNSDDGWRCCAEAE